MRKEKTVNALLICSFIFYTAFVIWNILFKYVTPFELFSNARYFSRTLNLVPFNDLFKGTYNKLDVWGNMLLFVPLGIYLKLWSERRWYILTWGAMLSSVILEVLQYAFAIGASDITDVIYNTLGFLIGIGGYYLAKLIFRENESIKLFITIFACLAVVLVTGIASLLYMNN